MNIYEETFRVFVAYQSKCAPQKVVCIFSACISALIYFTSLIFDKRKAKDLAILFIWKNTIICKKLKQPSVLPSYWQMWGETDNSLEPWGNPNAEILKTEFIERNQSKPLRFYMTIN